MSYSEDEKTVKRLSQIVKVIQDYSLGIFDSEAKVTLKKDELDGIAQGINVLGQNLQDKVTSLNTLHGILDSSPQLTITTDLASRITRVNKKGLETLCMNEFDVKGKHITEIIKSLNTDEFQSIYEKIFNEDNCYNFKVRVKTAYLNEVNSYCSAGVLRDYQNNITGIIFQFQDITELVETQNKLEIKNKELESFSYKVAHDLKGTLSSLEGLLDLVKEGNNPEEMKKYVNVFSDSLEFLQDTVTSLFEEATASMNGDNTKHVDFDKIIEMNRKALKTALEYTGETFEIEYINECEFPLKSEENTISSIFRNLIHNAYKHKNPNSDNFIKITIRDSEEFDCVEVTVEDNGLGMSEEVQETVFDFNTISEERPTGYELYFAYKAINKLKGSISFESEEGNGTVFNILIPNQEQVYS